MEIRGAKSIKDMVFSNTYREACPVGKTKTKWERQ
jgi:hypothetical protein